MKIYARTFGNLLAATLIAAIVGVGCHKRPSAITPLPGRMGERTPSEPAPGGLLGGNQAAVGETPAGFPTGPGHPGWNEDPSFFKSDTDVADPPAMHPSPHPGEKSKVAAVGDYLKANSGAAVKIEGHCDERGTSEYNRALGERRALALREELIRLGIDPNRVDTLSYGEDRPMDPGHDDAAWRKNRRGEFVLLTPPK